MLSKDLLRFNKKQKYCLFDFESRNLSLIGYDTNYPWQCSYIIFDQNRVYDEKDYYVNWGCPPSPEIQKMTGYSQRRMDEEGRDPLEVYKEFSQALRNPEYIVVGHNVLGFDIHLEKNWSKEVGIPHKYDYLNRLVDTLALAKAYRFDKKINRESFLSFQFKMDKLFKRGQKCKLSDLADEFGIDYDKSRLHDSSYDIRLNIQVFKQLIYKVEI